MIRFFGDFSHLEAGNHGVLITMIQAAREGAT
jgi:hypothetical protein